MFMRLKYSLLFINGTGVTARTLSWTTSDNYHRNPITSVKYFWPENEFKSLSIYALFKYNLLQTKKWFTLISDCASKGLHTC